jgi:hypothetical protein
MNPLHTRVSNQSDSLPEITAAKNEKVLTFTITHSDTSYSVTLRYNEKSFNEFCHKELLVHDEFEQKLIQTIKDSIDPSDAKKLRGADITISFDTNGISVSTKGLSDDAIRCITAGIREITNASSPQNRDRAIANSAITIISKKSEPITVEHIIQKASSEEVKTLMRFLISGTRLEFKDISWPLINGVLLNKDKKLLEECRKLLQEIIVNVHEKLQTVAPGSELEKRYEFLIGDLLTTYPFLEPHYEQAPVLQVPQKINGEWKLITFDVHRIQLGKEWMKPALYAYGLRPQEKDASSLLLFMGTPPPTTTGESIAKWVDFIPGNTVGEALYNMSKEAIEEWVNEEYKATGQPVRTYGKSLGGAMCLLTAVHCGPKIEAHAYNPPGLDTRMYNLYKKNSKTWKREPTINVISNKNDPVSELIGRWPKNTNFYKVIPEVDVNIYYAHIQSLLTKTIEVLKLDPKELNKETKRKVATAAFHIASSVLVIFNTLGVLFSSFKYTAAKRISRIFSPKPPLTEPMSLQKKERIWKKIHKELEKDPIAKVILTQVPSQAKAADKFDLFIEYGLDPKKLTYDLKKFSEKLANSLLPIDSPANSILQKEIALRFAELFTEHALFESGLIGKPAEHFGDLWKLHTYSREFLEACSKEIFSEILEGQLNSTHQKSFLKKLGLQASDDIDAIYNRLEEIKRKEISQELFSKLVSVVASHIPENKRELFARMAKEL